METDDSCKQSLLDLEGEEDNEWNGPAVAIEDRMSLSEASPLIILPVRALSSLRKDQAQVQGEKDLAKGSL